MKTIAPLLFTILLAMPGATAEDAPSGFCRLILSLESVKVDDESLELGIAKLTLATWEELFEMAEGLLKAKGIDRMGYLEIKHTRDAAEVDVVRREQLLKRQQEIVAQLSLLCGKGKDPQSRDLEQIYQQYLQAECNSFDTAIAIAEINLEYDRQELASMRDLREYQVASRFDEFLSELDVNWNELRLKDAKHRTRRCRSDLEQRAAAPPGD